MKTKLSIIVCALLSMTAIAQPFIPDASFGINGRVSCEFGTGNNIFRRMALQTDGKIVVCGDYQYQLNNTSQITSEVAVARLNPDGSLDETFGVGGKTLVPFMDNEEIAPVAMKILSDGKILLLCYKRYEIAPYLSHTALVKLNADGSPDNSFGVNGILDVDPSAGSSFATALEIQSDGKIVIGGQTGDHVNVVDLAVYRFNADGSRDQGFGTNGFFAMNWGRDTDPLEETYDAIDVIKIMPDGSILAAGDVSQGEADANATSKFVVIKLNANGTFNTSFGVNGKAATQFEGYALGHILRSIEVLPDEKIIITGISTNYDDYYSGLVTVKYNADGTLDDSYGNGGKTYFDNGLTYPKFANFASMVRSDGKLLIVGAGSDLDTPTPSGSTTKKSLLLQLNADGSVDDTFSPNGLYWSELLDVSGEVTTWDFALQSDGGLLLGGRYKDNGIRKFGLWRLLSSELRSDQFTANSFSVTPNPFEHYIDIRSNRTQNPILSVDLVDISGRNISNLGHYEVLQGQNAGRLNVSETLPKGVYFLKINDGESITTVKILK